VRGSLLRIVDRFTPPGLEDADALRRARGAVLLGCIGVFFAGSSALIYALLGSPISGAAVGLIAIACGITPFAVQRGISIRSIAHGITFSTWVVTFFVVQRTGGFSSPALIWSVLLPISMYPVDGKRGALVWAGLSALQVAICFFAVRLGVPTTQDFSPTVLGFIRATAVLLIVGANVLVLLIVDTIRQASEEALLRARQMIERERILGDMHDGLGSHLMGISLRVKAKKIADDELVQSLDSCVDDLRLIVNSIDPTEPSLEALLAEQRSRVVSRCDAANIELSWTVALNDDAPVPREQHLQILRAVQEMITNSLRHARTQKIDVEIRDDANGLLVSVADAGVGFSREAPPREGRGLVSLKTRARRLGGVLEVEPMNPGVRVRIRVPRPTVTAASA